MINLISMGGGATVESTAAAEAGLWLGARAAAVVAVVGPASAAGPESASALRAIAGPTEPASAPSAGRAAVSLGRAAANPEDKLVVCV